MITITFHGKRVILVKGHAGYAERGQDIVCSAVSAMTDQLARGLCKFCSGKYRAESGNAKIELVKESKLSEMLVYGFRNSIKDLAKQYPDNIKVEVYST